jgi:hypothetical protein
MDLFILGSTAAVGYYINKDENALKAQDKKIQESIEKVKNSIVEPSCENKYRCLKSRKDTINSQDELNIRYNMAKDPWSSGMIPKYFNRNEGDQKRKQMNLKTREQKNVRDSVFQFKEQAKEIEKHRDMLFAANDKIASNYDSELLKENKIEHPFNSIKRQLDLPGGFKNPITPDGFKRGFNNMTPHFGSNVTQSVKHNQYNQQKLEHFTGSFGKHSAFYTPKREVRIWPVLEDSHNIYGLKSTSTFIQNRLIPTLSKDGVKPFESIKVKPGIGLGANNVGQIGLHSLYRPLPKTIDETKIDKQISYTLPTHVDTLADQHAQRPTMPVVAKNRYNYVREHSTEEFTPTTGPAIPQSARAKFYLPETKKETTHHDYIGNASTVYSGPQHTSYLYKPTLKEQHCSFGYTRNPQGNREKTYNKEKSYYIAANERSYTGKRAPITNLVGSFQKTPAFDYDNVPEATKRDQTSYSYSGMAQNPHISKSVAYDPKDIARATRKQQTLYQSTGMAQNPYISKSVAYDPDDKPQATRKQQTLYQHSGMTQNPYHSKSRAYDPKDIAKSTRKQQTLFEYQGNYQSPYHTKSRIYDPDDKPEVTKRDQTSFQYDGNYQNPYHSKSRAYDPTDTAKATRKQQTLLNRTANYEGVDREKSRAYDPDDVARVTKKEQTLFTRTHNPEIVYHGKSVAYDPEDTPKVTRKEQTLATKAGNVDAIDNDGYDGYITDHDRAYARPTERESTSREYIHGGAEATYADRTRMYDDIKNTRVNLSKEQSFKGMGRHPTTVGYDQSMGKESVNLTTSRQNYRNYEYDRANCGADYEMEIGQTPNLRLKDALLDIENARLEAKLLSNIRL